jgi:Fe-S cluster assembly protein SufD
MMNTIQLNKVQTFIDGFQHPNNMLDVRQQAKNALTAMDFPTTRVEDWKYTRVTKISSKKFKQTNSNANISSVVINNLSCHQLVFVNGFYNEEASTILEDVVSIQPIEELNAELYTEILEDTDENVFSLINKAYSTSGVYIHLSKNQQAKYPIHLIHLNVSQDTIANTRHFIHAAEGSQLHIVSTFDSQNAEGSFTNMVFEGHIETNAKLTIDKIQNEDNTVFHMAKECFIQDQDSQFQMNTITIGGALVRNGLSILVEGTNCYSEINGVYLGKEKQHIDNHTFIDHLCAHCTSSETYKGVMDEHSTGVFNGKVIVREDAQKIQAYQSNGNILISDKASINSKPELEIYADDVRCSHGSTTGQLDEDALFYLQARGINKKSAQKLLVSAFIGEVLDKIENEYVRLHIDQLFLKRFGWEF